MFGQHRVDVLVVEGAAVVAFEKQGRAVFAEALVEVESDLLSIFHRTDQRSEAVAGGQVMQGDDLV